MEYDEDKVDDATLALLYLTMWDDRPGTYAWKSFDRTNMDRLHQKSYIADPKSEAKSVAITKEGKRRLSRCSFNFSGASDLW